MGNSAPTPVELNGPPLYPIGDSDERPVHRVEIRTGFYISEVEVTTDQFRQFQADFKGSGRFPPYATGLSWETANAFCQWLSQKEGKTYRLPTEAEWEYAARAGSNTLFSSASGDHPPQPGQANAWGLMNMNDGPAEWVIDWYGAYADNPERDPVGYDTGLARVVRGGGIQLPDEKNADDYDGRNPYYRRSANRASIAPSFQGDHIIGMRVVQADAPASKPMEAPVPFSQIAVKQSILHVNQGPSPDRPYFHRRELLRVPPDNSSAEEISAAGLDPAIHGHNHAPGLVICPNGDVLAVFFSSSTPSTEYWPDVSLISTRLRYGSEEWDMPGIYYDFADVNDQTSLLWNDNGKLWSFTGGRYIGGIPFRIQKSADNGATWSAVEFPAITGPLGGYTAQPINSAFRGRTGTIFVSSDATGGSSLLWASDDNGGTWRDSGGRTAGRHTTFALLKDGSILAMGGKDTDIEGYMPQVVSHDQGKTFTEKKKTPFPALASNQRPTLLRLASGRLFFAGDFQNHKNISPVGVRQRGSYVALSDDEGRTWTIKELPGTALHESRELPSKDRKYWPLSLNEHPTLGYTVARQAPNGVIHLITTMNHPCLHFELNEAWILDPSAGMAESPALAARSEQVRNSENYPDGKRKAEWSGVITSDGRYLLDGPSTFYFENGSKQYDVNYKLGEKIGTETLWTKDGARIWVREHRGDGSSLWTQFWQNGRTKSKSTWKDGKLNGESQRWDSSGRQLSSNQFENGFLKR